MSSVRQSRPWKLEFTTHFASPSMCHLWMSCRVSIGICHKLSPFRQSASCTHVSALLSALNPNAPSLASRGSVVENDPVPCTSLPCQWKPPRKRKESALRISDACFEKHEYSKPVKRKSISVEDFDPRPQKYRGQVSSVGKNARRTAVHITFIEISQAL